MASLLKETDKDFQALINAPLLSPSSVVNETPKPFTSSPKLICRNAGVA